MSPRAYDAILLDLDGTLVSDRGRIHPVTLQSLHSAAEKGVQVMIATGRSEATAVPVIEALGIDTPAVIYNGAAVYCPRERRVVEERHLSGRQLDDLLAYADRSGCLPVVMCAETKLALAPRSLSERVVLHDMHNVRIVAPPALRIDRPIRISLFSSAHPDADSFVEDLRRGVPDLEAYLTWFPLNLLPAHRNSDLLVIDVQPDCEGKAEAFRVLSERYGITPDRTVAVGDAGNDLPMLARAGLSVAMGNAVPEVREVADRVIGRNDSGAIGELVRELFLD